jgi:hypothetical protein
MAMNGYGAPAPGRNASVNASMPKRGQRTATNKVSAVLKPSTTGLIASAMKTPMAKPAAPQTTKKGK